MQDNFFGKAYSGWKEKADIADYIRIRHINKYNEWIDCKMADLFHKFIQRERQGALTK